MPSHASRSPSRRTSPPTSTSLATTATLTARQLRFERAGQTVLDGISLTVGPGTCLGVVGPNGVGKSTLLQLLAGLLEPAEGGEIRVDPPAATVGYLNQEHSHDAGETVRDALYRRTGAAAAEAEMTRAAAALGEGRPQAQDDYATALARYESLGAADFEARLAGVLEQVGLEPAMAERSSGALSGGQEARVALAAVLLARFDITLLDEPTNDLDFDGLARLEELVARRRGGMVIVSHDRAFLDGTVTDALEIEEHTRRGRLYGGGWAGYLAERVADRAHAEEAYAVYQSQRTDLARRAQRERQWATTGVSKEKKNPRDNDKAQRDFRINRTERLASRARRTERAMEALEVVEKPWEGWDLRFSINEATRSGAVVVHLEDAVLERGSRSEHGERGEAEGFVLGPFTLDIAWADRIALVGPNGSGKTTLVEALLGRLPLAAGTRRIGPSVVIGELGQDRRVLSDSSASVVEAFMTATGLPMSSARSQLSKFGLDAAAVVRPPSSLSPGERTRRSSPRSLRRASTFSCSTSRRTTWTCPQSNSSSPHSRVTKARSSSSRTTGGSSSP